MLYDGKDAYTLSNQKTAAEVRGAPVLVVGGLTYDNERLVNKDPAHTKRGQPARLSLWEVHPITEFLVCESATCDPAQHADWTPLTEWATKHPH